MAQVRTAISIGQALFEETDAIAQEMNIPRSQVVSMALEEYVRQYRNRQLLEQINEAYATPPSADEREILDRMRSTQKRLLQGDK